MTDVPPQDESPAPEVSAAAPESVPAAGPPPAAVLQSIVCPSCEAVLRNVSAQIGGTVRCLNCGKRFMVDGSARDALPQRESAGAPPARAIPAREPRAAGYWLLRIPAIILCGASLFGFALLMWNIGNFFRWGFRFDSLVFLSYWPLIPWAGGFLFFLSRAMSRIDASAAFLAWRRGIIKDSLPPATGSSLPYIAPLAIAGGVLPIACIRAVPDGMEATIIGTLIGAVMFYAGFALEDVRQFIWRQETLARSCCSELGIQTDRVSTHGIPAANGWLLSGALCLLAVAILSSTFRMLQWRTWRAEDIIPLFCALALFAVSLSLLILSRGWDRAVAWWQLAAGVAATKKRGDDSVRYLHTNAYLWEQHRQGISPPMRNFLRAPWIWTLCGMVWIFLMFAADEFRGIRFWESITVFSLCIMGALIAAWLSSFLAQVCRWRSAQEEVWSSQKGRLDAPLAGLDRWMTWGLVALVALQFTLFGLWALDNLFRTRIRVETLSVPLLMFMMHYPTLWLAMLLREALKLEQFQTSVRSEGSGDNAVEFENTELA